ncbi:MAG: histidine kinase dimerization/phospho-acceptor domain-containing protein [Pseudomonadota bacterium]
MVAAEAAAHVAHAQLVRIARLTTLGELSASIAHEVNQPLAATVTSANACLRWLDQDPPNTEKARPSVERVVVEANRASDVVARVRGLARCEKPQRAWIDVNEPIALARSEIERKGISLRLELAGALPPVLADGIQIQQVVGNLVLNAIDAMNEVPQARRSLDISSARDGAGSVVVSVGDSGAGLSLAARSGCSRRSGRPRSAAPASD